MRNTFSIVITHGSLVSAVYGILLQRANATFHKLYGQWWWQRFNALRRQPKVSQKMKIQKDAEVIFIKK